MEAIQIGSDKSELHREIHCSQHKTPAGHSAN
eukprot:SAG25_NODE_10404_length_336_cov_0.645570_1_plen_31_part_10